VRMLATNVISFTFYSVLVPMILLVYATEDLEASVHHRFMPWWSIVWMPMIVTMSTMAFSPNSFHYMILYVMYENAMSILKLGASLEGLLGLKGGMTWTVTQKLGTAQAFDLMKMLKKFEVFPRELVTGFLLMIAAFYGHHVGASWVFTVYFFTQGLIFLIFALSLVEAFNLMPPSESSLLGINKSDVAAVPLQPLNKPPKPKRKPKRPQHGNGHTALAAEEEDDEDDEEEEAELMESGGGSGQRRPPSLLRVLYANVVIFLAMLPINAFSILLLYGITTMLLSELINTQWDDLIALSLSIVIIPCHMFWCLGSPTANWKHRKQARARRLPLSTKLKHFVQLQLLYFYLFLLFLISMYSCSATLQDYVSREVYHMTGKWLEEFIDRR